MDNAADGAAGCGGFWLYGEPYLGGAAGAGGAEFAGAELCAPDWMGLRRDGGMPCIGPFFPDNECCALIRNARKLPSYPFVNPPQVAYGVRYLDESLEKRQETLE